MQRRFAVVLLLLLVLLLVALLVGRRVTSRAARVSGRLRAVPTARPTSVVPPTPIPARKIAVYFEAADEKLHAESRDVPVAPDDVAFLRLVAGAVLDGPRRPELLRPFPQGWTLRATYRLKDGIAVVDLAPPALPEGSPAPAPGALRWETGSHEEETAAQALLATVTRNIPEVTRLVVLVAGEPAETLAGHLDLTHPLRPDPARVSEEPPLEGPPPTPTPVVTPTATPTPVPTVAAPKKAPAKPAVTPKPRPSTTPAATRPPRPLAEAA